MTEDDGFFGLFKESSESERNFELKGAGWDKLNRKLNEDRAKRRRKLLVLIPWILLPGVLFFNGLLYKQQQEAKEQITLLNKQLALQSQIKTDTIIKEIHTYSHDTIYVYVSNLPLSNTLTNSFIKETQRVKNTYDGNDNVASDQLNYKVNNAKSDIADDKKTITHNDSNTFQGTSKLSGSDHDSDPQKKYDNDVNPGDSLNANVNTDNQSGNTVDSADQISDPLARSNLAETDSLKERKFSMNEYVRSIRLEYGVQAGIIFPEQDAGADIIGFNAGLGMNVSLSKKIQVFTSLNYKPHFVDAGKTNNGVWILPENSPDSTYTLDNASTKISALGFNLGLRYLIPMSNRLNLLFDVGYGAHYILPYKVVYEFKNQNPNQDLIVEKKPDRTGLILNDFLFGLGLGYSKNDRYTFYLLNHFTFNRQATPYKLPDNFGITIGLFY